VCCTHVYLITDVSGTIWVSKNRYVVPYGALLDTQDICTGLIDVTEDQWETHDHLTLKLET